MQTQEVAVKVKAIQFGRKLGEHFGFGPLLCDHGERQTGRNCPCGVAASNGGKWRNREAGGNDLGDVRTRERTGAQMRRVDVITGGNAIASDVESHRRESPND